MWFVVRRKKDGKYVSGTDYNYSPPHSILCSELKPPRLFNALELRTEIEAREINLDKYEVLQISEIKVMSLGARKIDFHIIADRKRRELTDRMVSDTVSDCTNLFREVKVNE